MKKIILSLAVFALSVCSFAQQITLEGIYGGKYRENSLYGVNSLNDGENYTVLTKEGLVKRSYASTLKKVKLQMLF